MVMPYPKHILIGVTGGIAAYKTATLVRLFVKSGCEVRVVMTPTAKQFITPLTLATLSQHPVYIDGFDPENGAWNSHIALGEWADAFVVAPATANTIAKMVHGVADNLLLTTYLSMRGKTFVAPAMDCEMYKHPTSQENLAKLAQLGAVLIDPAEGFLASGLEGKGRMAEPEDILHVVLNHGAFSALGEGASLQGHRILVTAGPTREDIDPVRFISNHSSGRMGAAIANALAFMGASVEYVAGPSEFYPLSLHAIKRHDVVSAIEMADICQRLWPDMSAAVMAAAVADYRPAVRAEHKIPHREGTLELTLVSNPDIARLLGGQKRAEQKLVGFALETGTGLENGFRKLHAKNMDVCVLNTLADPDAGFCTPTNRATFLYADGRVEERPLEQKSALGAAIAESVAKLLRGETRDAKNEESKA